MRLKMFLAGLAVGVALTSAGFFLFSEGVRDDVADATENVGEQVQKAGQKLEDAGDKIR